MFTTMDHKEGLFHVQLDAEDQGTISEVAAYYVITKDQAVTACMYHGIAALGKRVKKSKIKFESNHNTTQIDKDDG